MAKTGPCRGKAEAVYAQDSHARTVEYESRMAISNVQQGWAIRVRPMRDEASYEG